MSTQDSTIFSNQTKIDAIEVTSLWSKEEDELLLNFVNNIGTKWKFISKYFTNKTLLQVYNRYFKINPNIKKGRFTKEEDEKIFELVGKLNYDWFTIAKIFNNRTPKQIRNRYRVFLCKKYNLNKRHIR